MATNEAIQMVDELQPLGTLMYEDSTIAGGDSNWYPHRNIWKVIAHIETQDYPAAPLKIRNSMSFVGQEKL